MSAKVTVIIVTYHSRGTIGKALEALYPVAERGDVACIVVDNASTDGTTDLIEREFGWVTLVKNAANVGFGRGCNQAFRISNTPYLLLLNPDAVLDTTGLARLIGFAESHPRVGMCCPAVVESDGSIQSAGGLPTPWDVCLRPLPFISRARCRRQVVPGEPAQRTDWICGAIMLLRREVIEQVGGFDPRFFLYFEETDLCRRAQAAGWEIWTVGESVGHHVNAASAKITSAPMIWGTISEHFFRSRYYYLRKHFGWCLASAAEIGEIVSMSVRGAVEFARGRPYPALAGRLRSPLLRLPAPVEDASTTFPPKTGLR